MAPTEPKIEDFLNPEYIIENLDNQLSENAQNDLKSINFADLIKQYKDHRNVVDLPDLKSICEKSGQSDLFNIAKKYIDYRDGGFRSERESILEHLADRGYLDDISNENEKNQGLTNYIPSKKLLKAILANPQSLSQNEEDEFRQAFMSTLRLFDKKSLKKSPCNEALNCLSSYPYIFHGNLPEAPYKRKIGKDVGILIAMFVATAPVFSAVFFPMLFALNLPVFPAFIAAFFVTLAVVASTAFVAYYAPEVIGIFNRNAGIAALPRIRAFTVEPFINIYKKLTDTPDKIKREIANKVFNNVRKNISTAKDFDANFNDDEYWMKNIMPHDVIKMTKSKYGVDISDHCKDILNFLKYEVRTNLKQKKVWYRVQDDRDIPNKKVKDIENIKTATDFIPLYADPALERQGSEKSIIVQNKYREEAIVLEGVDESDAESRKEPVVENILQIDSGENVSEYSSDWQDGEEAIDLELGGQSSIKSPLELQTEEQALDEDRREYSNWQDSEDVKSESGNNQNSINSELDGKNNTKEKRRSVANTSLVEKLNNFFYKGDPYEALLNKEAQSQRMRQVKALDSSSQISSPSESSRL